MALAGMEEDRPEARDIETTFLQKASAESPGPFLVMKNVQLGIMYNY